MTGWKPHQIVILVALVAMFLWSGWLAIEYIASYTPDVGG